MITIFKVFENIDKKTTFTINDLVDYYNKDWNKIHDFIRELLPFNRYVIFNCKMCRNYNDIYNKEIVNIGKSHKGIIRGIGLGYYDNGTVYLSLDLKRIKYNHEVDSKLPMIIYGDIPDKLENIINEINAKKDANKYNL